MTQSATDQGYDLRDHAMFNGTEVEIIAWSGSISARHRNCPACGRGPWICQRYDVSDGDTIRGAWTCQLSPITEQATPDTEAFPAVGATISDTIQTARGAITITVQRTAFTYTIEVRNGSYRYAPVGTADR